MDTRWRGRVALAVLAVAGSAAGKVRPLMAQFATQDRLLAELAGGAVPAGGFEALGRLAPADPDRPRWILPAALVSATSLGFERMGTGPALTATSEDPPIRLLVARAARDTALVRRELAAISGALARVTLRNAPPPVLLAETELWLGDTAAARSRLEAFAARSPSMDTAVSWGGVRNGWLLSRTWALLAALRGEAGAGDVVADTQAVTIPAPPGGTAVRYRYDVQVWTRTPLRSGGSDTAGPVARLALVADEVAGSGGRAVRGVALEIPALRVLGDEGLAFQRCILEALRGAAAPSGVCSDVTSQLGESVGALGWMPPMPSRALRTGSRWTDTLAVVVPGTALGEGPVRLPVELSLTGIRDVAGRRLAFVTSDALARGVAVGGDGSRADLALSGEMVIDLADGLPVRTAASLRATVRDPRGVATPVRSLVTALRQEAPDAEAVAIR